MNDRADTPALYLGIAAVERDTGIGKDTLRVWERRYGFPQPLRDADGDRIYPPEQVQRLRQIKRLLDRGMRPGQVVPLDAAALEALIAAPAAAVTAAAPAAPLSANPSAPYIALLQRHEVEALHRQLARDLLRHGLGGFVSAVVAPLTVAVGEAWMRGELAVFEEHLYSEVIQRVLRQAIAAMPPVDARRARPRVLLTTVPQEPHILGLLMVEAMLALEGCACIQLGPQMPLPEIVQAVQAHRADVLALSFSSLLPPAQVIAALQELTETLPPRCSLWAGGSSAGLARAPAGVRVMRALDELAVATAQWRAANLAG